MQIIVPTLAVALVALLIWLSVRGRRERWAKRAALVIAILLSAYPLSLGPFQWLYVRHKVPNWAVQPMNVVYAPLEWIMFQSPFAGAALDLYVGLWVGDDDKPSNP